MSAVLTELINLIVGGLSAMATGIGTGIGDLVTEIFLAVNETGEVTGLSTFGSVIAIFAGISLAVGLSKLVVHWVSGLGGSKAM